MKGAGGENGVDDGLGVVGVGFAGEEEGLVFGMVQGAGEGAFLVEAALGGLDGGEGVRGVEDGVAEEEVEGAVEFLGAFFGGDFNACTAGAGEESGVGILVDLDVFEGGGGNAGAVDFHAVDDEGDAVGAGGIVGEEAGEGADVIHVEDGEVIEVGAIDGVGGLVVGGFGGELRGVAGVDGDALLDAGEVEGDFQRQRGAGIESEEGVVEAIMMDAQAIPGGFGEREGEGAGFRGDGVGDFGVVGGEEGDGGGGDEGAAGVGDGAGDGGGISWPGSLGGGRSRHAEDHEKGEEELHGSPKWRELVRLFRG